MVLEGLRGSSRLTRLDLRRRGARRPCGRRLCGEYCFKAQTKQTASDSPASRVPYLSSRAGRGNRVVGACAGTAWPSRQRHGKWRLSTALEDHEKMRTREAIENLRLIFAVLAKTRKCLCRQRRGNVFAQLAESRNIGGCLSPVSALPCALGVLAKTRKCLCLASNDMGTGAACRQSAPCLAPLGCGLGRCSRTVAVDEAAAPKRPAQQGLLAPWRPACGRELVSARPSSRGTSVPPNQRARHGWGRPALMIITSSRRAARTASAGR